MLSDRYPVLWVGMAAVVSAPVELDLSNAGELEKCLLAVLGQGARTLVVDMTATQFCDCAGMRAIMDCARQAAGGQASMRLVLRAPAVRRLFDLIGASLVIAAFPSVPAALMGAGQPYSNGGGG